ncbi:MAG: RIP metalloprotease RseP [Melioribacteraceae bacterium]|nr:RIP metalloprotease RseP [Melioribacteraceae bacterium]
MDYIIYFIITIGILVFIHELGHFLAAKICRMRTDVFAIGFGKRLVGWNKINGFTFGDLPKDIDLKGHTDYRLSLLPLGGYVKIAGMIDESFDNSFAKEEPKPYEFRSKPTIQKLFVITAGVMMNLTLTLAVFAGINFFQGKQVFKTTEIGEVREGTFAANVGFQTGDKIIQINNSIPQHWEEVLNDLVLDNLGSDKIVKIKRGEEVIDINIPGSEITNAAQDSFILPIGESKPMIMDVLKDSPASDAGIQPYDIFLSLNAKEVLSGQQIIDIVSDNKDVELPLVILRDKDTVRTSVTPGIDGKIGITINDAYAGEIDFQTYGLFKSFVLGVEDIIQYTKLTFSSIGSVIKGDIEFGSAFGGPVRIAQFAARSADLGLISFLRFLALLSLTLAILNIMPFPVLDGGHFVIILIEGIIRRELPLRFKIAIQNAGFFLLLLLMAFIIYNDIINL